MKLRQTFIFSSDDYKKSVIKSITEEFVNQIDLEIIVSQYDFVTKNGKSCKRDLSYPKTLHLTKVDFLRFVERGQNTGGSKISGVRFIASLDGANPAEYIIENVFRKAAAKPNSTKKDPQVEKGKKEAHDREYWSKTHPLRGGLPD